MDEPENIGVRIIANAPYSPEHNRAENAHGILNGLCFHNHSRSHVGQLGWSLIEQGSVFQYNRHPIPFSSDPSAHSLTRLEAFSGKSWDASTMVGFVGQG